MKLPPYAKNIPPDANCFAVCTGSESWDRAKSTSWLSHTHKTLLPLNDDIDSYRWSFAQNKEVVLFSNGTQETHDRLMELTRAMLSNGAKFVLWCIAGQPMNKFSGVVSE